MIALSRYEQVQRTVKDIKSRYPEVKNWIEVKGYPIDIDEDNDELWLRLLDVDGAGDVDAKFSFNDFSGAKLIMREYLNHTHIVLLFSGENDPYVFEPIVINHTHTEQEIMAMKQEADEMLEFLNQKTKPHPLEPEDET